MTYHNVVGLWFQLWIDGVKLCPEWIITHKPEEVAHSLVEALNGQHQCGLTTMHITEEKLTCSSERENKVIFSARLSHTTNASTTDIINHINKRLLNDSTVIILKEGTENETDTELIVEHLTTPSCFDHGNLTLSPPPAASTMLSASEIVVWIAVGLLLLAIMAIIILSIAVYLLKQQQLLYKTRLHSRYVIRIITVTNMFFRQQIVINQGGIYTYTLPTQPPTQLCM